MTGQMDHIGEMDQMILILHMGITQEWCLIPQQEYVHKNEVVC